MKNIQIQHYFENNSVRNRNVNIANKEPLTEYPGVSFKIKNYQSRKKQVKIKAKLKVKLKP